jgi:UDP-N-acetylglucosamine 4-epimerase
VARWLVTGAAGFIGSHLVEDLLEQGHEVVGLDDFSTGHRHNLPSAGTNRFRFIEGDIRDAAVCQRSCDGIDFVLHQAALGSVPRSIAQPLRTHQVNVDGFVNMLLAARDAKVKRFVYASSSSVYGDDARLPKREGEEGRPLSPYAVSKVANELYARTYARVYGLQTVGLRYFNVFGPRQDPDGVYAAVVPRWIAALGRGERCEIYGDGETSRDFCFVKNAVQANLKAATAEGDPTGVYNVAVGGRTSLKGLYQLLRERVARSRPNAAKLEPLFKPFREGDIKDSQADTSKAKAAFGYVPTHDIAAGLDLTVDSFLAKEAA